MRIEINPLDTLFFKDGKPFSMGEDSEGSRIFPPLPTTIYGFLRTLYFSNDINSLKEANEKNDPTKNLKIKGVYFSVKGNHFLPAPLDLVFDEYDKKENIEEKELKRLSLIKNGFNSSLNTDYILTADGFTAESITNCLIDSIDIPEYFKYRKLEKIYLKSLESYLINESKTGIGRDKFTRTSENGKLYNISQTRIKGNLKIVIEYEGDENFNSKIPLKGISKIGGEQKGIEYEIKNGNLDLNVDFENSKNDYFLIYISTPAIFKNGWLPNSINKDTLEGNINGIEVKLISAAIGKKIMVSGFDMKLKKPKTAYQAVPAGSIYYFKNKSGLTLSDMAKKINGNSISDVYKEQGFGIAYLGEVDIK